MFRSLVKLLPTRWAVFGAHLPGRDGRRNEAPQTSLAAYADAIADAVLAMAPAETILFGYSFGGNIAFEVAHRLAAAGQPVKCLIIAAARAPGVGCPDAPSALRAMAPDTFAALMMTMGLLPAEVAANPLLAQRVLSLMHADLIALQERALPADRAVLSCPMRMFLGAKDTVNVPFMTDTWPQHGTNVTVELLDEPHFFFKQCLPQLAAAVVAVAPMADCVSS